MPLVTLSLVLIVLGVYLFAKNWGLLGNHRPGCICERCRTRRLMGPAILVTLGVLFLLDNISNVDFGKTWPAILLVIGVVKLMQSNASYDGHVGPLPPGPGLQVERPELINAKHDLRVAGLRCRLAVGDRVQVLHPGLLRRVLRVLGGLPRFQALKGDAFLAEQDPQALVADVVDHPLGHQEIRQLGQAPGRKRQLSRGDR